MENVTTMSSKRIEEKPRDLKEDGHGRGMKQRWMQEGKHRKKEIELDVVVKVKSHGQKGAIVQKKEV